MTELATQDPAAIEREIRETQDNMSSTIDKIGDQLSIKNVFNALLDKADQNNVDARMVLDGAKRNPLALGLIAAGAIWLISDKDSKIPSLGTKSGQKPVADKKPKRKGNSDYISHMSSVEQRADEEHAAYQRRRDHARSNFFMIERGHEEDDGAFRQRLDTMAETHRKKNSMAESLRQKRHDFADRSGKVSDMAKEKATNAVSSTQQAFSANPLVSGIIAAAIGAAFGSALPVTRQEQEKLGPMGSKLRSSVGEQAEKASAKFSEKKDKLLEKADQSLSGNTDNAPGINGSNSSAEFRSEQVV